MKTKNQRTSLIRWAIIAFMIAAIIPQFASAASKSRGTKYAAAKQNPTARDAEVQNVKDTYWNRTSNGEVEVVQNRLYSKKNRLSIQAGGGTVSGDPFLNIKSLNGAIGYHFTETLAVNAIGRKYFVSDSSFLDELERGLVAGANATANYNRPQSYVGGEIEYSPLYGKISLSGSSIVHYDAHLLFGLGVTETDTGSELTPSIGLGPQFYLGNNVAVRLDYRITRYNESIPERVFNRGGNVGDRVNYSHLFNLGLVLFL